MGLHRLSLETVAQMCVPAWWENSITGQNSSLNSLLEMTKVTKVNKGIVDVISNAKQNASKVNQSALPFAAGNASFQ